MVQDSEYDAYVVDVLWITVGIVLLYVGGDLLVSNASSLARSWGLSPMVIGLTVVAFGTSAPELAASLTAALSGSSEISLGNVVGSNIANIGLILALSALIYPMRAQARFLKREMPILVAAGALLLVLFLDGFLGRLEAVAFVAILLGFLALMLRTREPETVEAEFAEEYYPPEAVPPVWRSVALTVVGLALLVAGAQLLVTGATSLARAAGVPELLIGLTVVAVGTSLPELAASIVAALRKQADIALGNVVGSNIFNILGILGITVLVRPVEMRFEAVATDMWAMLLISLLLWPFLATGARLGRREGGVLLSLYLAFIAYRFLA